MNLTLPSPLFNRLQSGESVRRVEQMTVEACNWIGLTPLRDGDNDKDSCLDAIGCPYPPANTPVTVVDETTGDTLDCVWGERGCKQAMLITTQEMKQMGYRTGGVCAAVVGVHLYPLYSDHPGSGQETWFFTSTISNADAMVAEAGRNSDE